MQMKNYILTSDKLVNKTMIMIEYFYKKYYPESKVVVLGYEEPHIKSDFVEFISLGKDEGPNIVCKTLFDFFKNVDEEYFIFEVDDKPIFKRIECKNLELILSYLKNNETIGRFGLTLDNTYRRYEVVEKVDDLVFFKNLEGERHKISATNSIWKRDYFLKYLNRFNNLWEWEVDSYHVSMNDGYECYGCLPAITDFVHLFKKGNLLENWNQSPHTNNKLDTEDYEFIKKTYKI